MIIINFKWLSEDWERNANLTVILDSLPYLILVSTKDYLDAYAIEFK